LWPALLQADQVDSDKVGSDAVDVSYAITEQPADTRPDCVAVMGEGFGGAAGGSAVERKGIQEDIERRTFQNLRRKWFRGNNTNPSSL